MAVVVFVAVFEHAVVGAVVSFHLVSLLEYGFLGFVEVVVDVVDGLGGVFDMGDRGGTSSTLANSSGAASTSVSVCFSDFFEISVSACIIFSFISVLLV